MAQTTKAHETLIIAFQGLMHFQTGKHKLKHVAIVDARKFDPCPHKNPKLEIWKKGECETITLQKDDVVSFNVASGKIRRDALYRKHVPKLRSHIESGEVHPKVIHQLPLDGVLAYFTLPPGRLTTWSTFRNGVEMHKKSGKMMIRCFAKFVVLETNIDSNVIMTIRHKRGKPREIKLTPRHVVIVQNIAPSLRHSENPSQHSDSASQHFPAYTKLLTDGGCTCDVHTLPHTTCNEEEGKGQFREEVEKILASYSHRAPNGDCGPTGP